MRRACAAIRSTPGIVPQAMSPQAFGELLRADYAKMARVAKLSGARID